MGAAQWSEPTGGIGLFQVGVSTINGWGRTTRFANRASGAIAIYIS
jgi:hypothetical protein